MPPIDAINQASFQSGKSVALYDVDTLSPPEVRILIDFKERLSGKRILDVGCGAGRTTPYLAAMGGDYLGLDYSPVLVERARQRFAGRRFVVGDARTLEGIGDGAFDCVVFSYNGLDYVDHGGRLAALAAIGRVLVPGGLFIFSSHNREHARAKGDFRPRLELTADPCRLLRNVLRHLLWSRRYARLRPLQEEHDGYAIQNDGGHGYRLLNYFIDIPHQTRQLQEAGFRLLAAFDIQGNPLAAGAGEAVSPWIHYVAESAP